MSDSGQKRCHLRRIGGCREYPILAVQADPGSVTMMSAVPPGVLPVEQHVDGAPQRGGEPAALGVLGRQVPGDQLKVAVAVAGHTGAGCKATAASLLGIRKVSVSCRYSWTV